MMSLYPWIARLSWLTELEQKPDEESWNLGLNWIDSDLLCLIRKFVPFRRDHNSGLNITSVSQQDIEKKKKSRCLNTPTPRPAPSDAPLRQALKRKRNGDGMPRPGPAKAGTGPILIFGTR
jgi:hypothetical protein